MMRKWVSAEIGSLLSASLRARGAAVDHAVAVRGDRHDVRHVTPLDRDPQTSSRHRVNATVLSAVGIGRSIWYSPRRGLRADPTG